MTKLSKKGENSMFSLAWLFLLQGLIYSQRTGSKEMLRDSLGSQYVMHQFLDVFLKSVLILLLSVVHTCSSISILVLFFRFKCIIMLWLFQTQILLVFWFFTLALLLLKGHSPFLQSYWAPVMLAHSRGNGNTILSCSALPVTKGLPYFIWHQWWQH